MADHQVDLRVEFLSEELNQIQEVRKLQEVRLGQAVKVVASVVGRNQIQVVRKLQDDVIYGLK